MENLGGVPPLTNRGGTKSFVGSPCGIALDWVTCTYQVNLLDPEIVKTRFIRFVVKLFRHRPPGSRSVQFPEPKGKRNGFDHRVSVSLASQEIASFSWGGNKGWACLEFRGAICSLIQPGQWRRLERFCTRYQARITRCDIAADYYLGYFETATGKRLEVSPRSLARALKRDPFSVMNNKGKFPAHWPHDEGRGMSYYIGRNTSSRQICCYEKSAQLSAKAKADSEESEETKTFECEWPDWVRVELRLRRDSGKFEIPYNVLNCENWWSYIAGVGEWFADRVPDEKKNVIRYQAKRLHVEFNAAVRKQVSHIQGNYGKFIYFLGTVLDPVLAWKVLCNTAGDWPQLERFPGWHTDETFLELLSASMLTLIPDSLHEGFKIEENKRLHAISSYLASKAGECYAAGFKGLKTLDYGRAAFVAPVACVAGFNRKRVFDNVWW